MFKITGNAANGLHVGLADGHVHLVYLLILQFLKQKYHFPEWSSQLGFSGEVIFLKESAKRLPLLGNEQLKLPQFVSESRDLSKRHIRLNPSYRFNDLG